MRALNFMLNTASRRDDVRSSELAATYMLATGPAYQMLQDDFGSLLENFPQESAVRDQPVAVGIATDIGQRARNEDSAVVLATTAGRGKNARPLVFAAVADGMGGHPLGDLASAVAVRTLVINVINRVIDPEVKGEGGEMSINSTLHALRAGVREANRVVRSSAGGGGTTLTCLLLRGQDIFLAHLGDSRAYWINPHGLNVLTRDHSLVQLLKESGGLTSEQAAKSGRRNMIYRALGIKDEVKVDVSHHLITRDSWLLLCSDGVWNALNDEIIQGLTARAAHPYQLCRALVESAVSGHRHADNATAAAIQIRGG